MTYLVGFRGATFEDPMRSSTPLRPKLSDFQIVYEEDIGCLLDVQCRQPIKLFQVVSTSEFHE